jgi:serine/threonine-protein kinase SRK2
MFIFHTNYILSLLKRITIPEIKQNPWFLKNMPKEIIEAERKGYVETKKDQPSQSVEEIMTIIQEARVPGQGSKAGDDGQGDTGSMNIEDDEEIDVSGDYENV